EHDNADDDTADFTNTTDKGYAADNTGCDGVQFVVHTGVGGVGCDTGGLYEAGPAVHSTGQSKYCNGGGEYVNAGNTGSFLVGAQSKHVLAEGGLVPDEPHEDGQEHCVDYVVGN